MLLAKSCMKAHNIKHGTIKLGTLHEYRETEIQHIADRQEGYLKFNLKFDGEVELTTKWFNTFAAGTLQFGTEKPIAFPGKTSAKFTDMFIVQSDNQRVILKDSSATIEREALNGFVFCMSKVRRTQDCIGIFPEYNDYWFVTEANALRFGFMLGGILREAIITGRATGKNLVPENMPLENFSVNLSMGLVEYIPRETHITNHNILNLEDFLGKMKNIAFIKPPVPFEKELEYRFNYTIVSDGKIIEPIVKFAILESYHLQQFALQIS